MFLKKYKHKKIAIYGMGLTGVSVAKTLEKSAIKIVCWDDNAKVRKKIKNIGLPINKFWFLKNKIDNIIISPGINIKKCKIRNYLKKNSNIILTDLDLFFELNKHSKIISITGTNGKSTTCKIIEKILKIANYNVKTVGNIGSPILSLNNFKKKYFFILELSSYQLEYSKLIRSKHAAILNISSDHLDRHGSIKNYTKIKAKIFFKQKQSDYSYINTSNKYSKILKNIYKNKKINSKLISVNKSSCNHLLKKINNPYFKSKGNIENLAFAYNIVKKLKINEKLIIKALNKFKGLPHRQEIFFSNKKILCINDSKATSFDACLQSLTTFDRIYWIVGGFPKLKDKFNLKKVSKKIVKAYIIGKSISTFEKKIKKDVPYEISYSTKNALKNIFNDIKKSKNSKSTILFSPAAASYDQFKNFVDRGNSFKNLTLEKLKKKLYV